jgi:hypothetical protein
MQGAYRYRILTIAPVALLAIASSTLIVMRRPLCVIDKVTCTLDPRLSAVAHTAIKEFLSNSPQDTKKASALVRSLHEQFPWINEVTIALRPERSLISIGAHTPYVQINNSTIITCRGLILEKQFFKESSFIDTPVVHTTHSLDQEHTAHIATFVATIPMQAFNFYTCHWHDSHTILLKDNHHPFIIHTSIDRIPSEKTLRACLYIKGTLLQNKSLLQKSYSWVADTRFSDHIIVGKRGNGNGTFI